MAVEQRYRVVERLEAGGMAEVFKGESLCPNNKELTFGQCLANGAKGEEEGR